MLRHASTTFVLCSNDKIYRGKEKNNNNNSKIIKQNESRQQMRLHMIIRDRERTNGYALYFEKMKHSRVISIDNIAVSI